MGLGPRVWDHQIGSLEVEWDGAGCVLLPFEPGGAFFRERRSRRDRLQPAANAFKRFEWSDWLGW